MGADDLVELRAVVGPEARAACGCAFVVAVQRGIDSREGRGVDTDTICVVPCRDAHQEDALALAREVFEGLSAEGQADLPGAVRAMAAALDAREAAWTL